MYQVTLLFESFQWLPMASGTKCQHLSLSLFHNCTPHFTNTFSIFFSSCTHWSRTYCVPGTGLGTGDMSCEPVRCPHRSAAALIKLFWFSPFTSTRTFCWCVCTHCWSSMEMASLLLSAGGVCFSLCLKPLLKCKLPAQPPHLQVASGSPGWPSLPRRLQDL